MLPLSSAAVERNDIGRTSSGRIVVAQDTTFYPTPPAQDIIVRDNIVHGSLGPMCVRERHADRGRLHHR